MIVYLETSVILRKLFNEAHPLKEWGHWEKAISSELSYVEAARSLDRLRLAKELDSENFAEKINELETLLGFCTRLELNSSLIYAAAKPRSTFVKTLDALHLVSAEMWMARHRSPLVFMTHDAQLGKAALASGMLAKGFRD